MRIRKTDLVDYRAFRLNKLNTPEFEHLKYLLFWPVYGLFFGGVERLWIRESYTPVHWALDDVIPFCEIFRKCSIPPPASQRDAKCEIISSLFCNCRN